jgi:hypothetical protein
MNYIISDTRLSGIMLDYLDNKATGSVSRIDTFIVVHEKGEYDELEFDGILLEFDSIDKRLYIYKEFLNAFHSFFPFGIENLTEFIKSWFESKFHVNVKFIHVSS